MTVLLSFTCNISSHLGFPFEMGLTHSYKFAGRFELVNLYNRTNSSDSNDIAICKQINQLTPIICGLLGLTLRLVFENVYLLLLLFPSRCVLPSSRLAS